MIAPQMAYPSKEGAACRRHVVQDDIGPLRARMRDGHIGERDRPIEAVLKDFAPGGDGLVDGSADDLRAYSDADCTAMVRSVWSHQ